MNDPAKNILRKIEFSRYSIVRDKDKYAILEDSKGEWVNIMDVNEMQHQINELKAAFTKADFLLYKHRLEMQLGHRIVFCPRCKQHHDDNNMRHQECPHCEFEWDLDEHEQSRF